FKGKGTELISQYVPGNADRSTVMNALTEEISQSSNIKSPQTRKNVQGALRKIINFLKQIDFKIPEKGIVVFAGNISESEGKTDIRLFTIQPPKELRVKLYWCDSQFHLDPLEEMIKPQEVYGLITIDKSEATLAELIGRRYNILHHFASMVPGKFRAGGQSSVRFERLREEAAQEFYKKMSEKLNNHFLEYGNKLKGIVVGGPGMTKNYFLNKGMLDHRLKSKVIGILDTSYTDESGIRELVQKSEEVLKDTDLMREKVLVNKFLEEIGKDNLAAYGEKEVMEALEMGKVALLLVSEAREWTVFKFKCPKDGKEFIEIIKEENANPNEFKCKECGIPCELLEEADYFDFMFEKAHSTGAEIKIISTETSEGEQFMQSFGGLGAILRYK
ncbi:MAG: peptide chain release factor 1, partial [Candidatus Diapherotrites archaeon]|nr:peptide chain release factor 1 [Candidatus Diapherotrites archaeon]